MKDSFERKDKFAVPSQCVVKYRERDSTSLRTFISDAVSHFGLYLGGVTTKAFRLTTHFVETKWRRKGDYQYHRGIGGALLRLKGDLKGQPPRRSRICLLPLKHGSGENHKPRMDRTSGFSCSLTTAWEADITCSWTIRHHQLKLQVIDQQLQSVQIFAFLYSKNSCNSEHSARNRLPHSRTMHVSRSAWIDQEDSGQITPLPRLHPLSSSLPFSQLLPSQAAPSDSHATLSYGQPGPAAW